MKTLACLLLALVSLVAHCAPVAFVWEASAEPYIIGYRLYYGIESRNYIASADAGSGTRATINLAPGTYFAVLTCTDLAGFRSLPSDEITFTVPGGRPNRPPAPRGPAAAPS